jgi:hypothetical protein
MEEVLGEDEDPSDLWRRNCSGERGLGSGDGSRPARLTASWGDVQLVHFWN